jgi:hypothetical protein
VIAIKRPARRSGVRRLAGSSITLEIPTKRAQEPIIPLEQLRPSHAEVTVVEDFIQPRLIVREGKKKRAPKKPRKRLSEREQKRMTRVEVAALLNKPGVEAALPQRWCKDYRALANRNVTIDELAKKYNLPAAAMEADIEGWESEFIGKTCQLFPKFQPRGTETGDRPIGEQAENEAEAAQSKDIIKTEGGSIGGRIVSGGRNPVTGRPRKLFDFERSGRLRETVSDPDDDRSGSQVSEEDDYGEDSSA